MHNPRRYWGDWDKYHGRRTAAQEQVRPDRRQQDRSQQVKDGPAAAGVLAPQAVDDAANHPVRGRGAGRDADTFAAQQALQVELLIGLDVARRGA
ncbi:MAG: hypothetical protein QGI33_02175, partial [Candidatus Brocadiia bacterium]|nr:hypothetical protein [Candidatus Brocadiia bacterium]